MARLFRQCLGFRIIAQESVWYRVQKRYSMQAEQKQCGFFSIVVRVVHV